MCQMIFSVYCVHRMEFEFRHKKTLDITLKIKIEIDVFLYWIIESDLLSLQRHMVEMK